MARDTLIALQLPSRSPAVYYRPHLEPVAGTTLVGWAVDRFRKLFPTIVVHHGGLDAVFFQSESIASRYQSVECATSSEVDALALAAASGTASPLLCCGIEAAFLPTSVFREAIASHRKNRAQWTAVAGLPRGVAVNVYDRTLLLQLAGLRMPGKPPGAVALIQRLSAENLRCVVSGAPEMFPAIRSASCQPVTGPQPRTLSISSAHDVEVARKVIEHHGTKTESLLAAWMDAVASPAPEPRWQPLRRSSRARVLFFSNHSGYSGAEEALVETVRALPAHRYDKLAFIPVSGMFADRMASAGCRVYRWAANFADPSVVNVSILSNLLRALKPALIHLNGYAGMPILAAARGAGIPLVQHLRLHELDALEEAMRESSMVLAVSEYVRSRTEGLRIAPRKIRVLYDGVDTARFNPALFDPKAARERLGIDAGRAVVLLAARLDRRKRAELFVEAIEMLSASLPHVLGILAGDDTGDPEWTASIDRLILEKNLSLYVRRVGFQPDMLPLYSAADVLVSCSDREALGCSVLEAMSMALPVVVSDSGGTMELVAPDSTGFVFPAGNAAALASALAPLLSQPNLRAAMGRRSRARILARFSIERCASSFDRVLSRLAATPSMNRHT